MKNKFARHLAYFFMGIAFALLVRNVAAQSEIEQFLLNFDGEYGLLQNANDPLEVADYFDSKNPYVKTIKQMVTSENGVTVMLDKVLVTEDNLTMAFLIAADFPDHLNDVQILVSNTEINPLLPYPEDSFTPIMRGGGGGGPLLLLANENPRVYYQIVSRSLMRYDGFISPSAPMQVKVKVPIVSIGWDYQDPGQEFVSSGCFYDEINAEFEFETDGAELASLTRTFDLNYSFELKGRKYSFDRLRFNPMTLILFATDSKNQINDPREDIDDIQFVNAETDDGTTIRLQDNWTTPYYGYMKLIIKPELIKALEQTKTLTLIPCSLAKPLAEYETYPRWESDDDYHCDRELAITVEVK